MSDYMDFNDNRSKTVIVCTVKVTDRKSKFINKTANECSEKELINEVFRQLKEYQTELSNPTNSILSPGVYKNEKENRWESIDTAYFYTKAGYKSNKSIFNNLYWVGSHNGNSNYSFTAMETAITNAISLLHDLLPDTKNSVIIHKPITVKNILMLILLIIFFVILYLFV